MVHHALARYLQMRKPFGLEARPSDAGVGRFALRHEFEQVLTQFVRALVLLIRRDGHALTGLIHEVAVVIDSRPGQT